MDFSDNHHKGITIIKHIHTVQSRLQSLYSNCQNSENEQMFHIAVIDLGHPLSLSFSIDFFQLHHPKNTATQ